MGFEGCEMNFRINIRFTTDLSELIDIADSVGYTDVQGTLDPTAILEFTFPIDDLMVTNIELSNVPELLEDFAADYINNELVDLVCFGACAEKEGESDSSDNSSSSGNDSSSSDDSSSSSDDIRRLIGHN